MLINICDKVLAYLLLSELELIPSFDSVCVRGCLCFQCSECPLKMCAIVGAPLTDASPHRAEYSFSQLDSLVCLDAPPNSEPDKTFGDQIFAKPGLVTQSPFSFAMVSLYLFLCICFFILLVILVSS